MNLLAAIVSYVFATHSDLLGSVELSVPLTVRGDGAFVTSLLFDVLRKHLVLYTDP